MQFLDLEPRTGLLNVLYSAVQAFPLSLYDFDLILFCYLVVVGVISTFAQMIEFTDKLAPFDFGDVSIVKHDLDAVSRHG